MNVSNRSRRASTAGLVLGIAAGAALGITAGNLLVPVPRSAPGPAAPTASGHALPEREAPGKDRWAVKTGTDPDAIGVLMDWRQVATVEDLCALPPPAERPQNRRVSPQENSLYRVEGTLVLCRREADGDYHLVLEGETGQHLVLEVPDPQLLPDEAPWKPPISRTRDLVTRLFHPGLKARAIHQRVAATGVGFWDRPHRVTFQAPNGFELHPLLILTSPAEGPVGTDGVLAPVPAPVPAPRPPENSRGE